MRFALLALLLASCEGIDVDDLSKSTKPNKEEFCTHKAHAESADGYFDEAIYRQCMFGTADRPGDAGVHD